MFCLKADLHCRCTTVAQLIHTFLHKLLTSVSSSTYSLLCIQVKSGKTQSCLLCIFSKFLVTFGQYIFLKFIFKIFLEGGAAAKSSVSIWHLWLVTSEVHKRGTYSLCYILLCYILTMYRLTTMLHNLPRCAFSSSFSLFPILSPHTLKRVTDSIIQIYVQ